MKDSNLNPKLDELFRSYREACPEVEGSANFMPQLWQKIETRQSVPFAWQRFTRLIVSAAAAMCLVMVVVQTAPIAQVPATIFSYIEVLESAHPYDTLAYADALDNDGGEDTLWQ